MRDKILLHQLQSLPLQAKITMAEQRIREWYEHFDGNVCISFSGGKDSTVLTDLVHGMYPDVPLVFANTGLEYPEIQAFARSMGAEFVRPKMSFSEVISTYGYPIISKEVAEAIHFARRIVPQSLENQYGGGTAPIKIQADRDARAEDEFSTTNGAGRNSMGNGTIRKESLRGRTGWRRANLNGQTPVPENSWGGVQRKRTQENQQVQASAPRQRASSTN